MERVFITMVMIIIGLVVGDLLGHSMKSPIIPAKQQPTVESIKPLKIPQPYREHQ